jgi:hypothetical protein
MKKGLEEQETAFIRQMNEVKITVKELEGDLLARFS